jgi:hypothetical protein
MGLLAMTGGLGRGGFCLDYPIESGNDKEGGVQGMTGRVEYVIVRLDRTIQKMATGLDSPVKPANDGEVVPGNDGEIEPANDPASQLDDVDGKLNDSDSVWGFDRYVRLSHTMQGVVAGDSLLFTMI